MTLRPLTLLKKAIDVLAVTLFCAMFIIVLLQIGFRYLLGDPLIWTEEQAQYLFIWVSFLGLLKAVSGGRHIAVTSLIERLGPKTTRTLKVFFELSAVIFGLILAYYGWKIMQRNWTVSTVTLFYPFAIVYVIVPAAAIALIVLSFERVNNLVKPQDR